MKSTGLEHFNSAQWRLDPRQLEEAQRVREAYFAAQASKTRSPEGGAVGGAVGPTGVHAQFAYEPRISVAALAPELLFEHGVAHIPIPAELAAKLTTGGAISKWLAGAKNDDKVCTRNEGGAKFIAADGAEREGTKLEEEIGELLRELNEHVMTALKNALPEAKLKTEGRTVLWKVTGDREHNRWHYDYGVAGEQDAYREDALAPEQRDLNHIPRPVVQATVALPLDTQAPTVAKPWHGRSIGDATQGPPGTVTVFLKQLVFHRADRRPGDRGLMLIGIDTELAPRDR